MRNTVFRTIGVTMTLALIVAFAAPQDRRRNEGGGGGGQRRESPPQRGNGNGNGGGQRRESPPPPRQRETPPQRGGGERKAPPNPDRGRNPVIPGDRRPSNPANPGNPDRGRNPVIPGDRRPSNPANPGNPDRGRNPVIPGDRRPSNPVDPDRGRNPVQPGDRIPNPVGPSRPGDGGDQRPDNGRRPRQPSNPIPPGRNPNPGGPTIPGRGGDNRNDPGRVIPPGRNPGGPGQRPGTPRNPDGDIIRRPVPPRSGTPRYEGQNNIGGRSRISEDVRIVRPRSISVGIQRRINDSERVRLIVGGGWRNGYYHYNRGWRDNNFCYSFYIFDPWSANRFVCSPWYYYSSLPPYLAFDRVVFLTNGFYRTGWYGNPYRWNRPVYNLSFTWVNRFDSPSQGQFSALDYAVDDITRAFERQDFQAMETFVPDNGRVNMYFDGDYGYSLEAADFYDLYADGIENVRTLRYDITDIRYDGRNGARVKATHTFTDPWGKRGVTYHDYFLVQEGGRWVIREFGTSNLPTN